MLHQVPNVKHCEQRTLLSIALELARLQADAKAGKLQPADLKGGSAEVNAEVLKQVLAGKLPGPVTDTVVLNVGAGLFVSGVAPTVKEGCELAAKVVQAGTPMSVLEKWVKASNA